jgi:hypothetical protein
MTAWEWTMSLQLLSDLVRRKLISAAHPAREGPRAECWFPVSSCPWSQPGKDLVPSAGSLFHHALGHSPGRTSCRVLVPCFIMPVVTGLSQKIQTYLFFSMQAT